jgi:hypothetical protein
MPNPKLYSPENVERVKYAQIGVVALTVAVCGYLAATALLSLRQVWGAQRALGQARMEFAALSRQASGEQRRERLQPPPSSGGVDSFAVQMSAWAKARGIYVESLVPEGTPVATEIDAEGTKLGTWNASKVRVKGNGDFHQIMSLLDEFRDTRLPARLESFALQSSQQPGKSVVDFDFVLTVYEKGNGTT